jgi:hypothetical protein
MHAQALHFEIQRSRADVAVAAMVHWSPRFDLDRILCRARQSDSLGRKRSKTELRKFDGTVIQSRSAMGWLQVPSLVV